MAAAAAAPPPPCHLYLCRPHVHHRLLHIYSLPSLLSCPVPRLRSSSKPLSAVSTQLSFQGLDETLFHLEERSGEEDGGKEMTESQVPSPKLSVKEKKELASYAHSLGKKLKSQQVGKSGITPSVAASFVENLESNELLKLFLRSPFWFKAEPDIVLFRLLLRCLFSRRRPSISTNFCFSKSEEVLTTTTDTFQLSGKLQKNKIKVHGNCPAEFADAVTQLEEATGSVAISQIGRSVILYRPSITKMKKKEEQAARARKIWKPKPQSPPPSSRMQRNRTTASSSSFRRRSSQV